MRIVSLTCSNTEIVAALGLSGALVGVDDHSDWPPQVVARLPRVGPDLEIDLDAVEALRPDLVLASLTVPGHETVVEGLEARGIPHLAPAPSSLAEIHEDIRQVAAALGVPERGEAVVARMRAAMAGEGGEPGDPSPGAPSILVQWWPKPVIAPGRESWVDEVIRAAGARNALGDEEVKSRPVADDEVARRAPDAVVISWCGVDPGQYRPDVVYRNPAFRDVPAIRNRRVFRVPEAFLGRPGPRLVEGVRALRALVAAVREGGRAPEPWEAGYAGPDPSGMPPGWSADQVDGAGELRTGTGESA